MSTSSAVSAAVGWLFPRPVDRERVRAMHTTVSAARLASIPLMVIFVAVAAATGNGDWWWFGPLAVICTIQIALRAIGKRDIAPEATALASFLIGTTWLAVASIVVGGSQSPFLLWMVFSFVAAPEALSRRAVLVVAGWGGVCLAAVAIIDWPNFAENPLTVLTVACTMIVIFLLTERSMEADLKQRHEAARDPLTGALNRSVLEGRYEAARGDCGDRSAPLSLLVFDLDHFKTVNDEFGHPFGDRVLRDAVAIAVECVRSDDVVFRLGGEEFCILLAGLNAVESAAVAERIREELKARFRADVAVTASFGVASASDEIPGFDVLYEDADRALYHAKHTGRDRVCSARDLRHAPAAA